MPQGQFKQDAIVDILRPFLVKPELIDQMAQRAKGLAILDATAHVAQHCEQVIDKKRAV